MFALDPRTILFVAIVIYCLVAVTMVMFRFSLRHQRGPGYWAAGTSLFALFSLMMLFRGSLPDWLSIVVGNQGVVFSVCLMSYGLAQHLEQRPRRTLYLVVCSANLLGFLYYCYIVPDFSARVVVFSLSLIVLCSEMALRLIPVGQNAKDPTRILVFCTLVACTLFYVLRTVIHSLYSGVDLMQDSGFNTVSLIFFPINVATMSTGLIAMAASSYARQKEQAYQELAEINRQLQEALNNVDTLSGLLPICAHCKKIRDDQGYWQRIEAYFAAHAKVDFTHGICPECAQTLYGDYLKDKKLALAGERPQKS